jgi:hypothetical protein
MENNNIKPQTFLKWLENQQTVFKDLDINLKLYQEYLNNWSKNKNNATLKDNNFVTALYVDLIKELSINFTSEEEKRFIANFDYTKKDNLDIIIPFFIKKLKNVCLFFSQKREELKEKIYTVPLKGTNMSVSKLVKNILISNIDSGFSQKIIEGKTTIPSQSAVNLFLDVKVEELYDVKNYFDNDKDNANSNTIDLNSDIFLNFKNSIISAIDQYPNYADSLINNLSVKLALSGGELQLLKNKDFINYIKNDKEDDLKLNLFKKLAPKYTSCSFYYLSTGNTISQKISGVLFDPYNFKKEVTQNLLNKNNISYAYSQDLNELYTTYELGKFFIPSKLGVLKFNSYKKTPFINESALSPNSVYVFPDPNVIEDKDNIISYKLDVSWNKIGRQDGFRFGDIITDNQYQLFYPYSSYSQELNTQPTGLSIATDDIEFWSKDEKNEWLSKNNLWSNLDEVEKLPIESRTQTLLFDSGTTTNWYTDIYGNQFILNKNLAKNSTIYDKNYSNTGAIFVKETQTGLVSTFKHFFNILYNKYPNKIIEELDGDIFSFYLIKNTLVIETSSYVLLDSYEYDIENNKIKNTTLPGIYVPKFILNKNLEKFVNSFYCEEDKNLYVCFLKLLPSLSASNYKSLYPVIYSVNIDTNYIEQIYPIVNFDSTIYSLSSNQFSNFPEIDLRRIEGGKFSYKKKDSIFNLTYYAFNNNGIPFIINEQFSKSPGLDKIYSYKPILHKPFYYVRDTNFSNPEFDSSLRHSSTYSNQIGYKDINTFNYTLDKNFNDKFHFSGNIGPVFVNVPGKHYIQFDWNSYVFGNVFIGCKSIGVTKVDNDNVIDLRDGSNGIILSEENKYYKILDYIVDSRVYSVSAFRPLNSGGTLVTLTVSQSGGLENDNQILCKDLLNSYKRVKIVKRGDGIGKVSGDPSCLDCGELCEFLYPLNSTISLIPSAAPDNAFVGWLGTPCQGLAGNCSLQITDNTTITAVFNKIPEYTLTVTSNISGYVPYITNADKLTCFSDKCIAIYKQNEVANLSGDVFIGMYLSEFKNTSCRNTYDCAVQMTGNLSVTAIYLSSINSIEIYNMPLSNGFKPGTVYCSLDPENRINTYNKFLVPSNTFVVISAEILPEYTFINFEGSPCVSSKSIVCGFDVTSNRSISAFYGLPSYTINVFLSGNGLFTVESNTPIIGGKKIDIGTRFLSNTRNTISTKFLSGENVTITGTVQDLNPGLFTNWVLLSAYNYPTQNITPQIRVIEIPSITSNITVSAIASTEFFDFTVRKVGGRRPLEHIVGVIINNQREDTVGLGVLSKTFKCVPGDNIKIKTNFVNNPVGSIPEKILYYIGSNNITYNYNTDIYFSISDGSNTSNINLPINDTLNTVIDGVTYFNQQNYDIPVFTQISSNNVLNVENTQIIYTPFTDNETISAVFG